MNADTGTELTALHVDGGAAGNELLLQFQADLLRVPVVRPEVLETTALGAATAAGLAVGFWSGLDELRRTLARRRPLAADHATRRARPPTAAVAQGHQQVTRLGR